MLRVITVYAGEQLNFVVEVFVSDSTYFRSISRRVCVIFITSLVLGFIASFPLDAQEKQNAQQEQLAQEEQTAQTEQIPEQQEQAPSEGIDIAEIIKTTEVLEGWETQLDEALALMGIENTFRMKLVLSGVVFFIFLLIIFVFHYLSGKLLGLVFSGRWSRSSLHESRVRFVRTTFGAFVFVFMLFTLLYALAQIWIGGLENIVLGEFVAVGLKSLAGIIFTLGVTVALFEVVSFFLERKFSALGAQGNPRITTLLPIVRKLIYGVLIFILGITFLSEIGIDIMPLLAGAGVVGFAVGFGAQTFVKDLITGFVIIIEDLIQVGDVASVGGKTGLVEKITLRKVQLRDLNGTVYTVPFSEIAVVENLTKDFSFYLFNIGIAYRENPDEVIKLIRELGAEMRGDEAYKDKILEDLEVLGVDAFADSAIIIKARLKTRPLAQWEVGREFNRRMKYLFDEHNIEIPFPHQTVYFGEDKQGKAPAAYVKLSEADAADASKAG